VKPGTTDLPRRCLDVTLLTFLLTIGLIALNYSFLARIIMNQSGNFTLMTYKLWVIKYDVIIYDAITVLTVLSSVKIPFLFRMMCNKIALRRFCRTDIKDRITRSGRTLTVQLFIINKLWTWWITWVWAFCSSLMMSFIIEALWSSSIGQVRSLRESILLNRTFEENLSAEDDSRFKNYRRRS